MAATLLILRPEPGASATATAARAAGLDPLVRPLFEVVARDWAPPPPQLFDALMLTSANAVRHAGPALADYIGLPVWCVGARTADAAGEAGFTSVRVAGPDAAALRASIATAGHHAVLHLGGVHVAEARETDTPLSITHIPVYESVRTPETLAETLADLPDASLLIALHSPRAARWIARLIPPEQRSRHAIIAISPAAADAAEDGWRDVTVADTPSDKDIIQIAARFAL